VSGAPSGSDIKRVNAQLNAQPPQGVTNYQYDTWFDSAKVESDGSFTIEFSQNDVTTIKAIVAESYTFQITFGISYTDGSEYWTDNYPVTVTAGTDDTKWTLGTVPTVTDWANTLFSGTVTMNLPEGVNWSSFNERQNPPYVSVNYTDGENNIGNSGYLKCNSEQQSWIVRLPQWAEGTKDLSIGVQAEYYTDGSGWTIYFASTAENDVPKTGKTDIELGVMNLLERNW
jgi:hypothetical protein